MDAQLKIFDLINQANPDMFYEATPANITLGVPEVFVGEGTRNTRLPVFGNEGHGYKGVSQVFYERLDLTTLFEGVQPSFRGLDFTDLHALLTKINTRYGTWLEPVDVDNIVFPTFTELETHHSFELVVKDQRLNWVGTVTVELIHGNPTLESVVLVRLMALLNHPHDMKIIGTRKSGLMSTWNFDFTAYKDQLLIDPKTGRWAEFGIVQGIGAKAGLVAWPNSTVVDLPTSAVPEANQNFQRVMVQSYSVSGVLGPIYFHYDLDW
ncbi:hypothetical protein D3C71_471690 [compost metagenome]